METWRWEAKEKGGGLVEMRKGGKGKEKSFKENGKARLSYVIGKVSYLMWYELA